MGWVNKFWDRLNGLKGPYYLNDWVLDCTVYKALGHSAISFTVDVVTKVRVEGRLNKQKIREHNTFFLCQSCTGTCMPGDIYKLLTIYEKPLFLSMWLTREVVDPK